MKAKILTLLFLALAHFAFAQKEPIPYEKLDDFSKTISAILVKMNSKTVKFNYDLGVININKDAFQVYSHNSLASVGYYHQDVLYIFEDFDLAKVESLILKDDRVVIYFIDGYESVHKRITYDENSNVAEKLIFGYPVTFYFETENDGKKLLDALYHLINVYKVHKGLLTETETRRHWEEYQSLKPYDFYKKYPQSVLAYEGKLVEEDFHRQVKFVESFGERYGVTVMNTFDKPKNEEIMETKYEINNNYYELPLKRKIEKSNNFVSNVVYSSGLILYKYTILMDKDYNLAKQKYNEIAKELTESLDNGLIREGIKENNMEFYFYLTTPNTPLSIEKANKKKIGRIRVELKEETYKRNKWYEVYVHFYSCNGC